MTTPGRLAAEDLELLADLVAERVLERMGAPSPPAAVSIDAAEVARRYGVTAAWVREHADQLGAIRLGDGPRPRLRFDADTVAAAMTSGQADRRPAASEAPAPTPHRRRRRSRRTGTGVELLPIRGTGGAPRAAGVQSGGPIKSGPGAAGTARGLAPEAEAPAQSARYPAGSAGRRSPDAAPPEEGAEMAPTIRATRRARAG